MRHTLPVPDRAHGAGQNTARPLWERKHQRALSLASTVCRTHRSGDCLRQRLFELFHSISVPPTRRFPWRTLPTMISDLCHTISKNRVFEGI